MSGIREIETVVPGVDGPLGAVVTWPDADDGTLPGMVLVDGSGDSDRHEWGELPEWLAETGAILLRHDKPGCGGSPGRWQTQSFEDRARETLAAVRVLRAQPGMSDRPIGLYGISQGGWVALLAASLEPASVDFVVSDSGPGVSPERQERERLGNALRSGGLSSSAVADGMAWVEERFARLRRGDSVESVLAEQLRRVAEPWYEAVRVPYDDAESLAFVRENLAFDPGAVMPHVECPVLALFGGADALVPVAESVAAFAQRLPRDPRHGIAVFPGADHGLFVAERQPGVPRKEQLAPEYLPTVRAFLADRVRDGRVRSGVGGSR